MLKQETAEAMQENQYSFPSSASGYSYESAQQLNTAFAHPQASSQMQNLAPFSNVMVIHQLRVCLVELILLGCGSRLSIKFCVPSRELLFNNAFYI